MNRRTAIKVLFASIFAPKILHDAITNTEAPHKPIISYFESGYVYAPYIPVMIVKPPLYTLKPEYLGKTITSITKD